MAQSSGCPIICNMCPQDKQGQWNCSIKLTLQELMWNGGFRVPETEEPFLQPALGCWGEQGGEGGGWTAVPPRGTVCAPGWRDQAAPVVRGAGGRGRQHLLKSSQHHQCSASRRRLINHWHIIYPTDTYSWVAHVWHDSAVGKCQTSAVTLEKSVCRMLSPPASCICSMTKTIPFTVYMPPASLRTAIPWDKAGLIWDWSWGVGKRDTWSQCP